MRRAVVSHGHAQSVALDDAKGHSVTFSTLKRLWSLRDSNP
jgi:hypothetical protein